MIPRDKIYHMIIGMVASYITHQFELDARSELIYSLISTLTVSIMKEVYDMKKKKPTGFDIYDIAAAIFGCLLMIIIISETNL